MRNLVRLVLGGALLFWGRAASAADHGDSPAVGADPASDIGDLFAWSAADGQRINLVMSFPAAAFSDQTQYVFHIASGPGYLTATGDYTILCRFDATQQIECWAGDGDDYVKGDASDPAGLAGVKDRMRVFAGQRNDPFFFNINGFIEVLNTAKAAVVAGAIDLDVALCPILDGPTSAALVTQLRTEPGGAPATDEFAPLDTAALVISIDTDLINAGGDILAVWGATYVP